MRQNQFHGIFLDLSFTDRGFPKSFPLFARKIAGDWVFYGFKVPLDEIEQTVVDIQFHMQANEPFDNHLYNDEELIVIFKERVFYATAHASSWKEIEQYGMALGIPKQQLDFWPNRFQDEIHYFEKDDFLETTI
jgi:hypothetical protein